MAIILNYDKNVAIRIRDFLLSQGLTLEGTYGMMANIYTESGFRSNNAQNSCMTKLGMTDEAYTVQVDNGQYTAFCTDRVGYGLCQWTSPGRKAGLFNYAKSKKTSVGDEIMQLNYLVNELSTAYKLVFNKLKTSHDISECAKYVMLKFERPANQSEENQNKRASYGLQLYKDLEEYKEEIDMGYTNSSLVDYIKISPNKTSPRNHKIDTITIHCYVGQVSVERIGSGFAKKTTMASCNYGIGSDGRIALIVDEKDRSWCSSNKENDHRAVTIEVACDSKAPYAVNNKAMESLIELCADICKRNDIKRLVWSTNKNERVNHLNGCNMTVHRDYKNKSCPGQYLYERHGYIASEVNKKLGVVVENVVVVPNEMSTYTVEKYDTLTKIGKKTGIAWTKIAKLNNLKFPYTLSVGQVLKLAESTSPSSTSKKFVCNGIDYSLVFDPVYYSNKYADLKRIYGTNSTNLFNHFKNHGMKEGRQASANFNAIVYKSRYADLQKAFGNNLPEYYKHYIQCGEKEGRQAL